MVTYLNAGKMHFIENNRHYLVNVVNINCLLARNLEKFWRVENCDIDYEDESKEKSHWQCEEYFTKTTIRKRDGKYSVKLPSH